MIRTLLPALALAGFAASAAAAPGDTIGSTVLVVDKVTAEYSAELRTLATGDPVRHSELIAAGPAARTELKLDDNTKLALGPGAQLRLDKFVYNPDKSGNAILVDLLKGTFRFMTGVAAKPSYVIRTPSAAITVRGTIFDVFVRENGETWLLLSEGGVQVCNARGQCRVLDEPGKLIVVGDGGAVGKSSCWSRVGDGLDFSFDEAFPFIAAPPSIDPQPVFTRAALVESGACGRAPKVRKTDAAPKTKPHKSHRIEKAEGPAKPTKETKVTEKAPRQTPVVKVVKSDKTEPTPKPERIRVVTEKPRKKVIRVVELPETDVITRPGLTIKFPRRPRGNDGPKTDGPSRGHGTSDGPVRSGSISIKRFEFSRASLRGTGFGGSGGQLR